LIARAPTSNVVLLNQGTLAEAITLDTSTITVPAP
jgi:hypothetical protein